MIKKYALIVGALFCAVTSVFGQYSIDFESAPLKNAYASGTVTLNGIDWNMTEAMIRPPASGDPDWYNGTRSARIRGYGTSVMTMLEDKTNGIGTISFQYRRYGTDAQVDWMVEYSTDGGLNWIQVGSSFTSPANNIVQIFNETIDVAGNARIRIKRATESGIVNRRLNIDDIVITDYVPCTDAVDWANVQFPNTSPQNIVHGNAFDVYVQAYEPGVTDASNTAPGVGLQAWVGYNTVDDDPENNDDWTWIPATYNVDVGNNDEFVADIGSVMTPGTYYYASRFQLDDCLYAYGGTGGLWNNDSVELIITPVQVDFCNVDFPKSGIIVAGNDHTVYAQAYEPGVTDAAGQGANIQAWIGYNSIGINHQPWNATGWTWVPAAYDSDFGNNDQYVATFGSSLSPGTYYYASRFQLNGSSYSYGGIYEDNMGNFWDDDMYISGILTVTNPPCSDLIISEYVEGSGNNKYLEIFNGTGAAVNLANYELRLYPNGNATPNPNNFFAALSGTIPDGGTIVYRNPNATIYSGASVELLSPNNTPIIQFNGNDAIALVHSGNIIDVFGQIGFNPGTAWTGGSVTTVDRTLIRKSTVQVGDSNGYDVFSPNVEWESNPINSVSELGYHFSDCHDDNELQLELPIGINVSCGYTYEFGNGLINGATDVILRIKNLGTLPLEINSLDFLTGEHYSLVAPPTTPFIIPAISYLDITVRFSPTSLGLWDDILTIESDDASESICSINFSGIAISNCSTTTSVIAAQDFESAATDTWNYTAIHAEWLPYWGVTTSLASIPSAQSGTNFWGITDLDRNGHENQTHELSFTFDVSAYSNVAFSFQYYTINIDATDTFEYEIFYDDVSQGIVSIAANTDAWTEVNKYLPDTVNTFAIIFYVDVDAVNDNAGLDNFILTSTTLNMATWDGAHWNWNDGTAMDTPPNMTTTVVLDGNYDTATFGDFQACELYLNSGRELIVDNDTYVEVEHFAVIDGDITVATHGAFVQRENLSNGFILNASGNASVLKSTSVINNWYDYTYWSSPVFGATVGDALNIAPPNRRFYFDAINYLDVFAETANDNTLVSGHDDIDDNGDDWQIAPSGMLMAPGQGFASTVLNSGFFPGTRQVTFEGPYNTGTLTTPIYYNGNNGDNDWNLIGNPYPSALSFNQLYDANSSVIAGAAYFWSHYTAPDGNNNGNQNMNFNTDDYAIMNRFGGNIAAASGATPSSSNVIPSGQSFFISGLDNGDVTYTNAMRMADGTSNTQFFRNQEGNMPNRLWLDLISDNGVFSQILLAYVDGATEGYDGMAYDAPRNLSSTTASSLFMKIEGETLKKFAIQCKNPNSLHSNEIIPLGFYTSIGEATIYTLSLSNTEGDFLASNHVYLVDRLLNIVHDLSGSNYSFTSDVGEFNDRFEIVFRSDALSVHEHEITADGLSIIELPNGQVRFSVASNLDILTVEIIDVLGRTLYNLKGNSPIEAYSLDNLAQATYIAKVSLSNGQVITKRAVKRK